MNKLQGKLVAGLAALAFFGLLGSAHAQAPAPAPMETVAPPMMQTPAPAPMSSDNMSGQLGFGAGVTAGTSFVVPGATVNMKYWLSDVLAIMPQLSIGLHSANVGNAQSTFAPAALALYCPWKTTSTRLSVGAGLGLRFAKGAPVAPATTADTEIDIRLPVYAGVEHFFTKWFSMGVAVQNDFLAYRKLGSAYTFDITIDNMATTQAIGFLFFYTD